MQRQARQLPLLVINRWRSVTLKLGYGTRSQTKVLLMLLDYAERNPDFFTKRP